MLFIMFLSLSAIISSECFLWEVSIGFAVHNVSQFISYQQLEVIALGGWNKVYST